MKHNLKVGQTIFLKPTGSNRQKEVVETRIAKIGNKYFYTEENDSFRYNIDTMKQDTQYTAYWKPYLSIQDIEEEKAYWEGRQSLRKFFLDNGTHTLTPQQVTDILKIINPLT